MRKFIKKETGVRICTALLLICFIAGCSAPMKFSHSNYQENIGNKYSPVSLVINNGMIRSVLEQDFHQGIITSFGRSGLFHGILINETEWPLKFDITISKSEGDKEWSNFGKLLLSALTLFLMPIQTYHEIQMDVAVKFKGKEIKDYSYTLKGGRISHIFINPVTESNEAMDTLVSYFLHDIQKDNLLLPIQNQYRGMKVSHN
jgi:hypothetical protein